MATMAESDVKKLDLDEDGYIRNIDEWNIHFVEQYAEKEGIKKLTADHWKLIAAIRFSYEKNGVSPLCRDVLKDTGFTKQAVYALFPMAGHKSAYKLAGLPKPPEC
ncbi:MAG TPA: TusE/DsrC/DsvC family sulfur relay protein [Thermodesulfovibrionales bacterium]|jgi:tRNA 2-thiouridine synthesizing protein E|nr:TusE/DsrC/DsvC family sulfur relay protein [Thermodesulfovibrionales bacterium]